MYLKNACGHPDHDSCALYLTELFIKKNFIDPKNIYFNTIYTLLYHHILKNDNFKKILKDFRIFECIWTIDAMNLLKEFLDLNNSSVKFCLSFRSSNTLKEMCRNTIIRNHSDITELPPGLQKYIYKHFFFQTNTHNSWIVLIFLQINRICFLCMS